MPLRKSWGPLESECWLHGSEHRIIGPRTETKLDFSQLLGKCMSLHVVVTCLQCEEFKVSPHTTEHAKVSLRCPPLDGSGRQHGDLIGEGTTFLWLLNTWALIKYSKLWVNDLLLLFATSPLFPFPFFLRSLKDCSEIMVLQLPQINVPVICLSISSYVSY